MKGKSIALFIILIGLILFLIGMSMFGNFNRNFNKDCSKCITIDCMDNDPICGDFGFYWRRGLLGVTFLCVGLFVFFVGLIKMFYRKKEVKDKINEDKIGPKEIPFKDKMFPAWLVGEDMDREKGRK